jgi:glucokinase
VNLGIDIRETSVAAVRADGQGTVIARSVQPGATRASAVDAIRQVSADAPLRVGVAVHDPADPGMSDIIAAAAAASRVAEPPLVVTKGGAVALAEQWLGAARGARHVVALTATDCVNAGIVINGGIFEGAHGFAGAAAWLALNPVERDDYRRLGCLEAEIGASGIVRRLVWRIKAGDTSRVLEMAGGRLADITITQVFEAARDGDGVAVAVVRDTARYIGMAIGNLVAIVDPEIVVLGGLMAEAADLLLEPSRAEAARRVSPAAAHRLQIVSGLLGDEAAALGAARAVLLDRDR